MYVNSKQAVEILKNNQVVAVPTETVYGLAGRISSSDALEMIFKVKKRPFFDPLIVHVKNVNQAKTLTSEWPIIADVLAQEFWPGPLTLVLRKNDKISDLITAGLERVGLRSPRDEIALKILEDLGEPFAAPSANLFGRTSPTSADHVITEFNGQIPVVDGGRCDIGIESTVLLVDQDRIVILRKGLINSQQIEDVLQKAKVSFSWMTNVSKSESPGHMKHHYMPTKPLFWIQGRPPVSKIASALNEKLKELPEEVEGVKLVIPKSINNFAELKLPIDATQAARIVYSELRRLAEGPEDCIVFFESAYHLNSDWEAVTERLKKASSALIQL